MIRWFAINHIAANFLMAGLLLAGAFTALHRVPLEVRPAHEFDTVFMTMLYRGATAKDVEKRILVPVEEALEGMSGIREIHADGYTGYARLYIKAKKGYDLRVLLEDVSARVEAINIFPSETERPRIYIPDSSLYREVLSVAVTGNLGPRELRLVADQVAEDLREIESINVVDLVGEKPYEISIEADMERLYSYQMGFSDLVDAVRRSSVDLPAGSIRSQSGRLVVKTRGQAYDREDFGRIPVRSANGAEVLLGEVASIRDGFEEGDKKVEFNGEPALFVEVMRTGNESAIRISELVRDYVRSAEGRFPDGINLYIFDDESISIRGRLQSLVSSLVLGSLLVLLVLGLFLRPTLAFWVVIGIPVCFAGGVLCMPWLGVTGNVMSLFGFIIVVGVVVDDAIVTGENVFSKMREGMGPLEAAIEGTREVAVPVTFGVLTTVVAFLPLMYFDGDWGDLARQIPPIVGPVLLFSLVESKLILPAHLKSLRVNRTGRNPLSRLQKAIAAGLERFIVRCYQPLLELSLRHRLVVVSLFAAMALVMFGYAQGGRLGFVSMPSVDRLKIHASLDMPNDTTLEVTESYVERIRAATEDLGRMFVDPGTGESIVQNVVKVSGASYITRGFDHSRGYVGVEVLPPSLRSEPGPRNSEIATAWHKLVGPIPEATSFRIRGEQTGGSQKEDGRDEESLYLELRGTYSEEKNRVAEQMADVLREFEGINTAWADISRGQNELEFTLKPRAIEMGITQQSLARQIRQAFYGERVQRIPRDGEEIPVFVRLPRQARESLNTLNRLKIRTPSGAETPLSMVADLHFARAPHSIERNAGAEIIRIGAEPASEEVDILAIARQVVPVFDDLVDEVPGLSYLFTGYVAEAEESRRRTLIGGIALFFALYALLAIPFKSMIQPLYVLVAVPFGIIGALLGHMILGITPSYLSVFGMLALAGVVVNDSLVLVDFVNRRTRGGMTLAAAVLVAGARRFRPIILTSITTFVGLLPLLSDRSIQAQFLIPMAVSLGFGVLFATAITLILVPCTLLLGEDIDRIRIRFRDWFWSPFRSPSSR